MATMKMLEIELNGTCRTKIVSKVITLVSMYLPVIEIDQEMDKNPKKDGQCTSITTKSDKSIPGTVLTSIEKDGDVEVETDNQAENEVDEEVFVDSDEPYG
ncbi:hypothetical protein KY290_010617 [Solanum tuberosum]|uniref:Polyprotein protein n=1 Tax=Solanum tuberosum TaxID=4113 RepID=A0ABQ7VYV7_SOLTU|nr:hypothetical protein KY290_010617 [Solanum tuberosum]